MIINKNRKGQAAIEFLMTYGWMLLIVLIVGALIFSFVDFGSLLPNKLELSNNLRGDPTGSVAYSADSPSNANQVKVVFRYNGARRVTITPSNASIVSEIGGSCRAVTINNLDIASTGETNESTPFLNGQDGLMTFNCSTLNLLEGDSLTGQIKVYVLDSKSGLEVPSTGSIRLQITE